MVYPRFEGFETFGEIACSSVGYANNVMIACFFECKHIFFTFGDDESGDGFLGYLQRIDAVDVVRWARCGW